MKKLKRFNIALIVLALVLGLSIGTAATLLTLNLVSEQKGLTLGGLICVLLATVLALGAPILVHLRDLQLERLTRMMERFGCEVSFLSETMFIRRASLDHRIYAARLLLDESLAELPRKLAFFAISKALEETPHEGVLIGISDQGEFLFNGFASDEAFLSSMNEVDRKIASDPELPPYSLLFGTHACEGKKEERCAEAVLATMLDEHSRDANSLLVYHEEANARVSLDFALELEKGRLTFALHQYGDIALLSPSLYDASRGALHGKDLFHVLDLNASRKGLDDLCLNQSKEILLQNPAISCLLVRLSLETIMDMEALPRLSASLQEAGIEPKRLCLCFPAVNANRHPAQRFANKAHGLGFIVGVYEFGGERADALMKLPLTYGVLKPELTRQNANAEILNKTLDLMELLGITPILNEGELGYERAKLPDNGATRLGKEDVA